MLKKIKQKLRKDWKTCKGRFYIYKIHSARPPWIMGRWATLGPDFPRRQPPSGAEEQGPTPSAPVTAIARGPWALAPRVRSFIVHSGCCRERLLSYFSTPISTERSARESRSREVRAAYAFPYTRCVFWCVWGQPWGVCRQVNFSSCQGAACTPEIRTGPGTVSVPSLAFLGADVWLRACISVWSAYKDGWEHQSCWNQGWEVKVSRMSAIAAGRGRFLGFSGTIYVYI